MREIRENSRRKMRRESLKFVILILTNLNINFTRDVALKVMQAAESVQNKKR